MSEDIEYIRLFIRIPGGYNPSFDDFVYDALASKFLIECEADGKCLYPLPPEVRDIEECRGWMYVDVFECTHQKLSETVNTNFSNLKFIDRVILGVDSFTKEISDIRQSKNAAKN